MGNSEERSRRIRLLIEERAAWPMRSSVLKLISQHAASSCTLVTPPASRNWTEGIFSDYKMVVAHSAESRVDRLPLDGASKHLARYLGSIDVTSPEWALTFGKVEGVGVLLLTDAPTQEFIAALSVLDGEALWVGLNRRFMALIDVIRVNESVFCDVTLRRDVGGSFSP